MFEKILCSSLIIATGIAFRFAGRSSPTSNTFSCRDTLTKACSIDVLRGLMRDVDASASPLRLNCEFRRSYVKIGPHEPLWSSRSRDLTAAQSCACTCLTFVRTPPYQAFRISYRLSRHKAESG